MLRTGVRKYLFNPILGLLPYILYLLLHISPNVEELHALSISLVMAVIGECVIRFRFKTKMYSLTFYVSILALISTILFWTCTSGYPHAVCSYVIFSEVVLVLSFMLIRASRVYIAAHFFKQKDVVQKAWLNEFYQIALLIQYGLTIHLFFILLYDNFRYILEDYVLSDYIFITFIPVAFLLTVGFIHIIRVSSLIERLKTEEWLPIVTEKGEVKGKIAKSVSLKMKNKFLHPIVRVALICDDKLFLQERRKNDILDPSKLDYPFEKYMLFNHEINLAARNSIVAMMGPQIKMPIKFILKYTYENDNTKRLNLLFVANVENESDIKRTKKMTGKFWSIKQIEDAFADEVFSEPFELEFEYLKNTILSPKDICKSGDC